MSIVIIGGNERMIRNYIELCKDYKCSAKVFIKMRDGLKNRMGKPDLLVLFTSTTAHEMVKYALCETKGEGTIIERSHSSSMSALKKILEKHIV